MTIKKILEHIDSIEKSQQQPLTESKQPVNEKYMGFKKTVAAIKKGGSAENPEAVAASIGREKYGKEKFQKAAAAGKKLGEQQTEESALRAYLGKRKYGEEGMKALQQAGREGASKEEMASIRAKHDKMDEQQGVAEGIRDDAMAGLQKTIDFAKQHGYKIYRSPTGRKMRFVNSQLNHEIRASVDNEGDSINVNFMDYLSGTSGNDDASYFDQVFKDAYQQALKDSEHSTSLATYDDDDDVPQDRKYWAAQKLKKGVVEGKGKKPDFLDLDKDGNRKESMKDAAKDRVDESWTDFEDAKKTHTKFGSKVTGRHDDYTVTSPDGERRRYITKDGKRKIERLPPVAAHRDDDEDTGQTKPKAKKEKAAKDTPAKKETKRSKKKISEMNDFEFSAFMGKVMLIENEMSDEQKAKKEKIAQAMKDSPKEIAGLKKRYGKRWENVVHATATARAMGKAPKKK